jgi:hypothetical protein
VAENGVEVSVAVNDPDNVNAFLNCPVEDEVVLKALYTPDSDAGSLGILELTWMADFRIARKKSERFFSSVKKSVSRIETIVRDVIGDANKIAPDFGLSGDLRHPCSE